MISRLEFRGTHHSGEKLETSELSNVADVGCVDDLGDRDEAEIHDQREDVELQQPFKKQKVGEDGRTKPAPNLLQSPMPHNQPLSG